MRRRLLVSSAVIVGLLLAGCASTEEWRTWREHPAHFASGDHLSFSVRNTEGKGPHVLRRDLAMARDEAWWGKAVSVGQDQILER